MAVEGSVFFLSTSQGPTGFAHGGAVAQVLDDVCGLAFGAGCFTLSLEIQYKQGVPLLTELHVDAIVESIEESSRGRKIHVVSRLRLADGTVTNLAKGLFYQPAALRVLWESKAAEREGSIAQTPSTTVVKEQRNKIDPAVLRRRREMMGPYYYQLGSTLSGSGDAHLATSQAIRPLDCDCHTIHPNAVAEWARWNSQDAFVQQLHSDPDLVLVEEVCRGKRKCADVRGSVQR
jgi:hypothetical protein